MREGRRCGHDRRITPRTAIALESSAGFDGTFDPRPGGRSTAHDVAMAGDADDVRVLTVHECLELLRSGEVGRLAISRIAHPEVFPVNYTVDHGTVVFRTAPGTKLDALTRERDVTFEVDGYDRASGDAWSVIIKGRAERVEAPHERFDAADLPLFPWQTGSEAALRARGAGRDDRPAVPRRAASPAQLAPPAAPAANELVRVTACWRRRSGQLSGADQRRHDPPPGAARDLEASAAAPAARPACSPGPDHRASAGRLVEPDPVVGHDDARPRCRSAATRTLDARALRRGG